MNDRDKRGDLRARTRDFALRIMRLYAVLPKAGEARVLGDQLLRSGTSVGANYREAMRARSKAEFVSKVGIAIQELEETDYWLELLAESGIMPGDRLADLRTELSEIMAMLVSSAKTAKRGVQQDKR